jgi:hypothetical protein
VKFLLDLDIVLRDHGSWDFRSDEAEDMKGSHSRQPLQYGPCVGILHPLTLLWHILACKVECFAVTRVLGQRPDSMLGLVTHPRVVKRQEMILTSIAMLGR